MFEAQPATIESIERTSWLPLAEDSHVCGVESRSVNNSGLSGSSHGIAAALLQREKKRVVVCERGGLLAELGMDMANLFKHFFREYIFIIFSIEGLEKHFCLQQLLPLLCIHVLLTYYLKSLKKELYL